MSEAKHNPPAFPRTGEGVGNPLYDEPGMTLRDWFAGHALAGIVANGEYATVLKEVAEKLGKTEPEMVAGMALEMADAMLAARAKGGDA